MWGLRKKKPALTAKLILYYFVSENIFWYWRLYQDMHKKAPEKENISKIVKSLKGLFYSSLTYVTITIWKISICVL